MHGREEAIRRDPEERAGLTGLLIESVEPGTDEGVGPGMGRARSQRFLANTASASAPPSATSMSASKRSLNKSGCRAQNSGSSSATSTRCL